MKQTHIIAIYTQPKSSAMIASSNVTWSTVSLPASKGRFFTIYLDVDKKATDDDTLAFKINTCQRSGLDVPYCCKDGPTTKVREGKKSVIRIIVNWSINRLTFTWSLLSLSLRPTGHHRGTWSQTSTYDEKIPPSRLWTKSHQGYLLRYLPTTISSLDEMEQKVTASC